MRKGDEKRQDILSVAERLFCQKGYKETSVQDILDVLKTSKGSFYHHFDSKEQLLATLCVQRAQKSAETCMRVLGTVTEPMARINTVLHATMPLRREEVNFLGMLLPQIDTPEGRVVCLAYQDALQEAFLPLVDAVLDEARTAGLICPPCEDSMADILLTMMNRCWLHVAQTLLASIKTAQRLEPAALLDELTVYRAAVERLLDAPYGTVELIRLQEWFEVAQLVEHRVSYMVTD